MVQKVKGQSSHCSVAVEAVQYGKLGNYRQWQLCRVKGGRAGKYIYIYVYAYCAV